MAEPLDKCVWMWAGLLSYRLCDRAYECSACPVDRLFHSRPASEASSGHAPEPAPAPAAGRGLAPLAPDRFHDQQHLWMRVLPEGRVLVGLDPMAAKLLRGAQEMRLPAVGTRLKRGDPAVTVRFPGGDLIFASPMAGLVERAHRLARFRLPAALRRPYSGAWMLVLGVTRLERQLTRLLVGGPAGQFMARDWRRFQEECLTLLAAESAPALPDGGALDLDHLERSTPAPYHALVRRWIGVGRLQGPVS